MGDKSGKFLAQDFRIENYIFVKSNYLNMKILISFFAITFFCNVFCQSICFSNDDDVMTYVIYKSFENEDGTISLEFSSSQAVLRAGDNTFNYMYDQFTYMGSGYKGKVEMTELGGNGGLEMYVSCKERMMTDNNGTLLYESGTKGSNYNDQKFSLKTVKINNLEFVNVSYQGQRLGSYSWESALRQIEFYGGNWRIPTFEEMNLIFENSDDFAAPEGGNTLTAYDWWWSSSLFSDFDKSFAKDSEVGGSQLTVNFKEGQFFPSSYGVKTAGLLIVRGTNIVANNEEKENKSVGKIVNFGDLQVKIESLGKMDWDEAKEACEKLGNGWRLPTIEEADSIYKNREELEVFSDEAYWSCSEDSVGNVWYFDIGRAWKGARADARNVIAVRGDNIDLINAEIQELNLELKSLEKEISLLEKQRDSDLKIQQDFINKKQNEEKNQLKIVNIKKNEINILKAKITAYGVNQNQIEAYNELLDKELFIGQPDNKKLSKFNENIKELHTINYSEYQILYSNNALYIINNKAKSKFQKIEFSEKEQKQFDKLKTKEILLPVLETKDSHLKDETGLDKQYFILETQMNEQENLLSSEFITLDSLKELKDIELRKKAEINDKFSKLIDNENKLLLDKKSKVNELTQRIKNIELIAIRRAEQEEKKLKEKMGRLVKIGNFEVTSKRLAKANFNDAKKECEKLGDKWRLPTIEELELIFKNKDKFDDRYLLHEDFWSSSESKTYGGSQYMWYWSKDKKEDMGYKDWEMYFIAVREL